MWACPLKLVLRRQATLFAQPKISSHRTDLSIPLPPHPDPLPRFALMIRHISAEWEPVRRARMRDRDCKVTGSGNEECGAERLREEEAP